MIRPGGKVFQIQTEPYRTVWLRRDESLFTDEEWSWVAGEDHAWIFERLEDADTRAAELKAEGAEGVHVFVYGSTAVQEQQERATGRARRNDHQAESDLRSARAVSPADAYAELEKRHLD